MRRTLYNRGGGAAGIQAREIKRVRMYADAQARAQAREHRHKKGSSGAGWYLEGVNKAGGRMRAVAQSPRRS